MSGVLAFPFTFFLSSTLLLSSLKLNKFSCSSEQMALIKPQEYAQKQLEM